MIALYICLAIALISILSLIGWFFNEISKYQDRIDKDTK